MFFDNIDDMQIVQIGPICKRNFPRHQIRTKFYTLGPMANEK